MLNPLVSVDVVTTATRKNGGDACCFLKTFAFMPRCDQKSELNRPVGAFQDILGQCESSSLVSTEQMASDRFLHREAACLSSGDLMTSYFTISPSLLSFFAVKQLQETLDKNDETDKLEMNSTPAPSPPPPPPPPPLPPPVTPPIR